MWTDGRTLKEIQEIQHMVDIAYGNRCRKIRTSIQYEEKMAKLYDAGYRVLHDNTERFELVKIRIKHYADGYEELVNLRNFALWNKTALQTKTPIFQVVGIVINGKYIDLQEELE